MATNRRGSVHSSTSELIDTICSSSSPPTEVLVAFRKHVVKGDDFSSASTAIVDPSLQKAAIDRGMIQHLMDACLDFKDIAQLCNALRLLCALVMDAGPYSIASTDSSSRNEGGKQIAFGHKVSLRIIILQILIVLNMCRPSSW